MPAWLLATLIAVAVPAPAPAPQPSPSPAAAGPCANPPLSSIAVRPGIGRAPATGGAVCVAPPGTIVVGAGYRAQVTGAAGMRQTLAVNPAPVALVGLPANTEIIVEPGLAFSHRAGSGAFPLAPANGQQDAGFGIQHLLSDRPWTQQAVEFFATSPTGYPDGPNGFSAGAPSYQLSYAVAFALSAAFGVTLSDAVLDSSGAAGNGSAQRYLAEQPALSLSLALGPATAVLLEDQIASEIGPHGSTGNRSLLGLQQTLSPNLVLDVDQEWNLLPPPGVYQHTTIEGGVTVRI